MSHAEQTLPAGAHLEDQAEAEATLAEQKSNFLRRAAAGTSVVALVLSLAACQSTSDGGEGSGAAVAASAVPEKFYYFYAGGYQSVHTASASVKLSQEQPKPGSNTSHSLAELALVADGGKDSVEIGWTIDQNQTGDTKPYLFVTHEIDGNYSCLSNPDNCKPDKIVNTGEIGTFAIKYVNKNGGEWDLSYNSQVVKTYPASEWGGKFKEADRVQISGEIAATTDTACGQMGNGKPGNSAKAASISDYRLGGSTAQPNLIPFINPDTAANPFTYGNIHTDGINYGGTGAC